MKKYYIHDGDKQSGAFDIEELKAKKITKETPIWYEGIENWTTAEKVEELKVLFETPKTPPPFNVQEKQTSPPEFKKSQENKTVSKPAKQKKGWGVGQIFLTIGILSSIVLMGFFFAIDLFDFGGSGSSFSSSVGGYDSEESYYENVMSVEEVEQSDPERFLETDGYYNENLLGDKLKLTGTITNNATVATYKDAVIRVTYYSETKTDLGSEDYVIYQKFPPTSTTSFKLKIQNYRNVATIGWEVIDADVYY